MKKFFEGLTSFDIIIESHKYYEYPLFWDILIFSDKSIDDLIQKADRVMYKVKKQTKNQSNPLTVQ